MSESKWIGRNDQSADPSFEERKWRLFDEMVQKEEASRGKTLSTKEKLTIFKEKVMWNRDFNILAVMARIKGNGFVRICDGWGYRVCEFKDGKLSDEDLKFFLGEQEFYGTFNNLDEFYETWTGPLSDVWQHTKDDYEERTRSGHEDEEYDPDAEAKEAEYEADMLNDPTNYDDEIKNG